MLYTLFVLVLGSHFSYNLASFQFIFAVCFFPVDFLKLWLHYAVLFHCFRGFFLAFCCFCGFLWIFRLVVNVCCQSETAAADVGERFASASVTR